MTRALVVVLLSATAVAQPKSPRAISAPREIEVNAVYFTGSGASAEGGTTAVKLRISPNPSRQPSVGVMEEFAGGTGSQWRTAVWQAAFAASAFNRVSLSDYEFLVRVGGHIDGPSAGLLMAASFVALQRGQSVLPRTTMTGTINPDGSSGPVGGIVQKMRGAAAQGFKRFGFPIGAREQIDVATGAQVDLLAVAQELKLEARELRTLEEAYVFLTGADVPQAIALPDSEMDFTVSESQMWRLLISKVDADGTRALQDVQALLGQLETTDANFVQKELATIEFKRSKAREDIARGRLVSGYFGLASAHQFTLETASFARVLLPWRRNDFAEVATTITLTGKSVQSLDLLSQEIDVQFPAGSVVNDAFAFDVLEDVSASLVKAVSLDAKRDGLAEKVRALRASSPVSMREQVLREVRQFAFMRGSVEASIDNARRFASAYAAIRPAVSAKGLDTLAGTQALYGSGSASLAYFDALVTEPQGAAAGLTIGETRSAFEKLEPAYRTQLERQQILGLKLGSPRLRFVFAYLMHIGAAWLSNKYYSLGAMPKNGVVTISNPRALTAQFDLARAATLQSCNDAQLAGWLPTLARARYASAMEQREGSDATKLGALEDFWLAKFWCDYVSGRVR